MNFEYEPWELTAHALGELSKARAQEFEQAVAANPSLAAEINATREMISSLQTMLASDPESRLDAPRRAAVLCGIELGTNDPVGANRVVSAMDKPNVSPVFTLRRSIAVIGALAASILVIGFIVVNSGDNQNAALRRIASADVARKLSFDEAPRMMNEGYSGGAREMTSGPRPEQLAKNYTLGTSHESIPNAISAGQSVSQPAGNRNAPVDGWRNSSNVGGIVAGTNLYYESDGSNPVPAQSLYRSFDNGQVSPGQTETVVDQPAKRLKDTQVKDLANTVDDGFSVVLDKEKKEGDTPVAPRYDQHAMRFSVQPLGELEGRAGNGREAHFSDLDESARKLGALSAAGRGAAMSGDKYEPITDNPFYAVSNQPLSTFSIDVDTASYSKIRQYLMELNQLPRPDAVRIEELVNYFQYNYAGPKDNKPFASSLAVAACPWQPKHKLVRIALQAKKIDADKRPLSSLVFLLDISGSMNAPNRLPLVKKSIQMLARQLGENDQVAIVVYLGAAGLVLDTTSGKDQSAILSALDRLAAGGSTNGGEGIQLAYAKAREQFIPGGVNRVILCTDGDFNVGVTGTDQLVRMVEENAKSKIFLTVLGFGMGNNNDAMLQQIADRGNGMHGFIDTEFEANRMMVEQISGSLITVAKDVKIQVEFNPAKVGAYRLIGYENRVLAAQDFNNDKKDAGEIGAGHCVTALYEIVPANSEVPAESRDVDASRYQKQLSLTPAADTGELLTVKLRYKEPEGDKSSLLEFPLVDREATINDADRDFRWSAAVAQFGMLLRHSPYKGESNWDSLLEMAEEAAGRTPDAYREQALQMMRIAKGLK